LHLLSLLTHEERILIGQEGGRPTNKRDPPLPPALASLDISGHLAPADALHTHATTPAFSSRRSRDFLLYADLNQPKLYEAIASCP